MLDDVEKAISDADSARRSAINAAAQPYRAAADRGELLTFSTLDQIERMSRAIGGHWFDADALRFFGSRVYCPVLGGRFFVSSEKHPEEGRWDAVRRYTVRECRNGDIETVNDFGQYATLTAARNAAKRAAAGAEL